MVKEIRGEGYTSLIVDMISQSWLKPGEVDRTLWQHWMVIVIPDEVTTRTGLLVIGGGSNGKSAPDGANARTIQTAMSTRSVVTELTMIPNQPLVFDGNTKPLYEDALISYTWDKFLRSGQSRWLAQLPMTKSVVRAMDTITAVCADPAHGATVIDSYVVAGASKRGWTTWTTAAVDERVVAIAPIVIDMLNAVPSFNHHYEVYGFYSPAVEDYVRMRIMDWQETPEYEALLRIVEPYEYRDRLTMPKFLINATGDQYFLPDSSRFYFDELKGPKWLRYIPTADHSLKGSDAWESLAAFYKALLHGETVPTFTWTIEDDGLIQVRTMDNPSAVKLWQATNTEARDFRLETIGKGWTSSTLADQGKGLYIAKVSSPEKGWTAFMVEMTYDAKPLPFKFTTPVRVIPDTTLHKLKPATLPKSFLTGAE